MDMTSRSLVFALLAAAASSAALPAIAATDTPATGADASCEPRVVDGWLRSPPMPMPMMAGFARVENPCAGGAVIVAARSDAFASIELHETTVVDGVSRMRPVAEVPLPAGGEAVLRPGGLHLMLMKPASPLATGDSVRVEFVLADGRSVAAGFEVRAPDAR